MATEMVPPQLNSRLGFINPGLTLYPLVNVYYTELEHHPFLMGKSTISMAMFTSYMSLPEGIRFNPHRQKKILFIPIESPCMSQVLLRCA